MDQKPVSRSFFGSKSFWLLALSLTGFLAVGALLVSVSLVQAAPALQVPIYTPTPLPDGRIIYIVKANDTLLSISLISGVPVEELRELNNLSGDTIFEGQELLLGLAGPPETTPTLGPAPTETPVLPTPSPRPGVGTLCILVYNDINGDSIRQEEEPSIPDAAVSISNRSGSVSEAYTTGAGLEHECFENLPEEEEYTISVAVPEGYNATTESSKILPLRSGNQIYVNFGAQADSETQAADQVIPEEPGRRSPLLGIIGGIFLLIGLAVAIFAGRYLQGR
jgi:LysM repeat protein